MILTLILIALYYIPTMSGTFPGNDAAHFCGYPVAILLHAYYLLSHHIFLYSVYNSIVEPPDRVCDTTQYGIMPGSVY